MVWLADLGDEADTAGGLLSGDEAHLGRVADLQAGEPALRHLDHRQHRIERHHLRDRRAHEGERRAADFARYSVTMPSHGARSTPRSRSASACARTASAALNCDFEIHGFELRHGALLDQLAARFELGLALIEQCAWPARPAPRARRRTARR